MKKIELLAPAGSFEKAKIAFLYGADAVYMGTRSLSLRTRVNVDDDELESFIRQNLMDQDIVNGRKIRQRLRLLAHTGQGTVFYNYSKYRFLYFSNYT